MDNKQQRGDYSSKDDWIKCQSKTRPNKFYMFKKSTGETRWCSELEDKRLMPPKVKETSLSQICTKAPVRTPAQDRLKRLQNNLKKEYKEKLEKKKINALRSRSHTYNANSVKEIDKITLNVADDQNKQQDVSTKTVPETDNDTQPSIWKSTHLVNDKMESNKQSNDTVENVVGSRILYKSPAEKISKKRAVSSNREKNSTFNHQKRQKQELQLQENVLKSSANGSDETATSRPPKSITLSVGNGFITKIKDLCKRTFSNVKNVLVQKPIEPCIKRTDFKIPTKKSCISRVSATRLMLRNEQAEKESISEESNLICHMNDSPAVIPMTVTTTTKPSNDRSTADLKATALTASHSQFVATPNKSPVLTYERGSANKRLNRLRQSLHQQALTSTGKVVNTPTKLCASDCSTVLVSTSRAGEMVGNNHTQEANEPMDWMPIEEFKTEITELVSTDAINAASSVQKQEPENMGEYYGTINGNLLRYAVEQRLNSPTAVGKWMNDFYYFVLDTNILLQHLTFVEDISHMTLCDTGGTVLYIPYCVLQELDKLKQFAAGEGTKVLAVRAIKYLNRKFESKAKCLQAQSALSDQEHLVEATSPDDRIINCCLQVKQNVDHVILLTEDINLRTKAICNNILVSTKSDLLAQHT